MIDTGRRPTYFSLDIELLTDPILILTTATLCPPSNMNSIEVALSYIGRYCSAETLAISSPVTSTGIPETGLIILFNINLHRYKHLNIETFENKGFLKFNKLEFNDIMIIICYISNRVLVLVLVFFIFKLSNR